MKMPPQMAAPYMQLVQSKFGFVRKRTATSIDELFKCKCLSANSISSVVSRACDGFPLMADLFMFIMLSNHCLTQYLVISKFVN